MEGEQREASFPAGAGAQDATRPFEELPRIVTAGQKVVVVDERGRRASGRVERLSTSSITVDARTFTETEVREIRLVDPLWNGALIGGGIGFGLALWDYLIDPSEPGNAVVFTVTISVGTAVGAGIDALKSGQVLYASRRQTMLLRPLVGEGREGAALSVRF